MPAASTRQSGLADTDRRACSTAARQKRTAAPVRGGNRFHRRDASKLAAVLDSHGRSAPSGLTKDTAKDCSTCSPTPRCTRCIPRRRTHQTETPGHQRVGPETSSTRRSLAAKLRGKLLYGTDHPYGAYPDGRVASAGCKRAGPHRSSTTNIFSPDNATLAVVGDVRAADEITPLVEKAFADWKVAALRHGPQQTTFPAIARAAQGASDDASRGPTRQRAIEHPRLRPGRRRATTTTVPELGVLNSILGGGFPRAGCSTNLRRT